MEHHTTPRTDLREALAPLTRRVWLIVAIVVTVTGLAYWHYSGEPKTYEASARIFVGATAADTAISGNEFLDPTRNAANLAAFIESRKIGDAVARDLEGKNITLGSIEAQPVEDTDFITLTSEANSARDAAGTANGYATAFLRYRSRRIQNEAQLARQVAERQLAALPRTNVNGDERRALQAQIDRYRAVETLPVGRAELVDDALVPSSPTGPAVTRITIFAFVLALLAGISLAYLLERLDRRIRKASEIEPLIHSPILSVIPHSGRLATARPGETLPADLVESFRTLRTNLQVHRGETPTRTILVASAVAGEGKSTVANHLALALREYGARVALVEADLRRPTLSRRLGVDRSPGLSEHLAGRASLDEVLQPLPEEHRLRATVTARGSETVALEQRGGTIDVLPSGQTPNDPLALLRGERFNELFSTLHDDYDYVIVDSPPLMAVSDALPLASAVDGVLLVVRVGLATRKGVTRAVHLLENATGRRHLLGAVATDAEISDVAEGYGGYY